MRTIHTILAAFILLVCQACDQAGGDSSPNSGQAASGDKVADTKSFSQDIVFVQLTDVKPMEFNKDGQEVGCRIKMNIENKTKYHLNMVVFKLGAVTITLPEMVAKTKQEYSYDFDNVDTCSQTVVSDTHVYDCNMRGIAEGDCQDLIQIDSIIDKERVNELRKLEEKKRSEAQARDKRERDKNHEALELLK